MKFIYRIYAIERMFQRNISEKTVEDTIQNGTIIEEYLDDKPYPSFLKLGFESDNPKKTIHVVYAQNENEIIIITVYRPDPLKWKNNYTTRIQK